MNKVDLAKFAFEIFLYLGAILAFLDAVLDK